MKMQNKTADKAVQEKTCHACLASIPMGDKRCPYCGEKQLSPIEYRLSQGILRNRYGAFMATKVLLAVLVILFVAMSVDILTTPDYGLKEALLSPPGELIYRWGAHLRGDFVWWRLITANFVHIGIVHIVFNAYALRYVSPYVERAYGASLTFVSFLLTGTASMLISNVLGSPGLVAGASGGLMGFIGLAAVSAHREKTALSLEVRNSMLKWAASVRVFGIVVSKLTPMGIDNIAHAAGFVMGAALGFVLPTQSTTGFTKVRTIRLARLAFLAAFAMTMTSFGFMTSAGVSQRYQGECIARLNVKAFEKAQRSCEIAYRTDKSRQPSYHNYILVSIINGKTELARSLCTEGRQRFKDSSKPLSFDEMCRSVGK